MQKAIVLSQIGGPEVLELKQIKIQRPGKGEVLVRHTAIGINYIDVYYRNGIYPLFDIPAILGQEACGYIEAVGEGVKGWEVGEKVAYVTPQIGSYCEFRTVDPNYLIKVPDYINDQQVASILFKGMTAHYLLRRTFYVKPDDIILIHAAAGGVGQILCQWARYLNATVIATVGSEHKMEIAKKNGCDYIINYNEENFVDRVLEITNGQGVSVVYDSVGKNTFNDSIKCLTKFGLMVSYGQASGAVPPIDLSILAKKANFLTRPSLFDYKSNRMELILSSNEVFEMFRRKHIKENLNHAYHLKDAVKAHRAIEERETSGGSIFII